MQIVNTYKCNFTCGHCLFTCSPRRKEMLTTYEIHRFLATVGHQDFINLCGGELFLNPEWEDQLRVIAANCDQLRIVTNGSYFYTRKGNETKLLKKFRAILEEIFWRNSELRITICISDDDYHIGNYFDKDLFPLPDVIRYFKFMLLDNFSYGVTYEDDRSKMDKPVMKLGRAKKLTSSYVYDPQCTLTGGEFYDLTLLPNGDVAACCNGKGIIGRYDDSMTTFEENFKKLKLPKTCSKCKI